MLFATAGVKIVVHTSEGATSHNLTISARSTISNLITQACEIIPGSVRHENVVIKQNNTDIVDTRAYVILYEIDTPFHICKTCMLLFSIMLQHCAFCIAGHRKLSWKEKVVEMQEIVHPPSKHGRDLILDNNGAKFKDVTVYCHRNNAHGNHVALYYNGFYQFTKDCASIDLTKDDCRFTSMLCNSMAKFYPDEPARQKACNDLMSSYFGYPLTPVVIHNEGKTAVTCDGAISKAMYLEYKNEVGAGNCDSFLEVISHYIEGLPQDSIDESCLARFLLEIVGPHMFVSGVAFGEHVYVDRLTPPLWLVLQPRDDKEMLRTARTLKALKTAFTKLSEAAGSPIDQPRFPSFCHFNDRHLTYVREISRHIFGCTLSPDGSPCIVKFCDLYGKSAHTVLADEGYAPTIHYCEQFGMFTVVVMDEVTDAVCVDKYLESHVQECEDIIGKCTSALDVLHRHNFCHGDFRAPNILVTPTSQVFVIDFEWSGIENQVRYPMFMNHSDIVWPDGAEDGMLIKCQHDIFWLEQIRQQFGC